MEESPAVTKACQRSANPLQFFLGNELSEIILGLGYKGPFMVLAEHINAIPITLKSFLFAFFFLAYIEIRRGIYDSQRNCPAT